MKLRALLSVSAVTLSFSYGCASIIGIDHDYIDDPDAGSGGKGGVGSASGSGGAGAVCAAREDCPADTDCKTYQCQAGHCDLEILPENTEVQAGKTPGDCMRIVCSATGLTTTIAADDPPPSPDPCTTRACDSGDIVSTKAKDGASCGTGLYCKGGECSGCKAPEHCPVPPECQSVTCVNENCLYANVPDGEEIGDNSNKTDCVHTICNGGVKEVGAPDITETPPSDGNLCTDDTCDDKGMPAHPPVAGAPKCAGAAGECLNDSVCVAGACAVQYKPAGALLADGIDGDCKQDACDGAGNKVILNADDPPADDPADCTTPICVSGAVQAANNVDGSVCGAGGTKKCCAGSCCTNTGANYCVNAMCCPTNVVCGTTCCASGGAVCGGAANDMCCNTGAKCGSNCCPGATDGCLGDGTTCCALNKICNGGTVCCAGAKICMGGTVCL